MHLPRRLESRILAIALLSALRCFAAAGESLSAEPKPDGLEAWLLELERSLPKEASDFAADKHERLATAANAVEKWAVQYARFDDAHSADQLLAVTKKLLAAKGRVDRLLDDTLRLRTTFAALEDAPERRDAIRAYLRATAQLIDLSGRLRYLQVDALNIAVPRLVGNAADRRRLIELFIAERSSVGALVANQQLWAAGADRAETATVARLLELIAVSGQSMLLPQLAQFLESGRASPELAVATAETIRRIGLPQAPRPNPSEPQPTPPITAARLHELLSRLPAARLSGNLAARHAELLAWLDGLRKHGLGENRYRLGTFDVEPGDWLLMRNPSPYNLFTDLSPGLFTHVGVVTLERGADGIQRMVLVDLPERGARIPAANVEAYLERSLHWCILRHPDPAVAAQMAAAARDMIGNESLFDLTFRTDRVLELKGRPLAGRKIHTYCAGLLLLCALQTPLAREEFFPIVEAAAGGRTVENLQQLGLSVGEDFLSPTGALFSPRLELVGLHEAMYDPQRQIEEAVFDHFAHLLAERRLTPSPDWFQSLRSKLAEASRGNPLLAQALAAAAGVSADTDLVSAAKAAAVVETLDEIAFGASGEFLDARATIREQAAGGGNNLRLSPEERAEVQTYLRRHTELYRRFRQGLVSPRRMRIELVEYYIQRGRSELERRFFATAPSEPARK